MQWTILDLLPKPQMSERRSSTIRVDVERPDNHCGHDRVFVFNAVVFRTIGLRRADFRETDERLA